MEVCKSYKQWIRKGKGYCSYCNEKLERYPITRNDLRPTIDHQIPTSRGGRDSIENIVACCKKCNEMKGDYTVPEFLAKIEKIRNYLSGN